MLIIPERRVVLITPPRGGSTALKTAVLARYPDAISLYRHMEADGVPLGYDHFERVGLCRNPLDRLWSLFKYLQRFGIDYATKHDPEYTARLRASVEVPFEYWLRNNTEVFTSPYDRSGGFHPYYCCRHPLPENRKSQYVYLRPDLGTKVIRYADRKELYDTLDIKPERLNSTAPGRPHALSAEGLGYMEHWFQYDFDNS